ncbi:MAG: type VI secretion system baseplate subunit TssG [Gemmataceae bacterium]
MGEQSAEAVAAKRPAPTLAAHGVETSRVVRAHPTLTERLLREPFAFNFFQAVRLLEMIYPDRQPVGRGGPPLREIARFRALVSLVFPPSAIFDLEPADPDSPPVMSVAFLGLHGPSGILPRHYTEMLLRIEREVKTAEKHALRDWFDLFNHRFISLFFRAWQKYRFWVAYERGEHLRPEPDPFTQALYSLIGIGMPSLRQRLRLSVVEEINLELQERTLAKVDDLALLYYGGLLKQRPRNATNLERLLEDYFQLPVHIEQFHGQWLYLEPDDQSRLTSLRSANQLGVDAVAGQRVYDVQSKFRICIGPLGIDDFNAFLPDRAATGERKTLFLLSHLTRMFVGPEYDFEVQLTLCRDEVPRLELVSSALGPRLGWNTWVFSQPFERNVEDAVFDGQEPVWLCPPPPQLPVHRIDVDASPRNGQE